jgi:hypothetical protein
LPARPFVGCRRAARVGSGTAAHWQHCAGAAPTQSAHCGAERTGVSVVCVRVRVGARVPEIAAVEVVTHLVAARVYRGMSEECYMAWGYI